MHSNLNCLSKLKPYKKSNIALSGVLAWINWTYNRIYALDISAYNDHDFTAIEPALLSSATVGWFVADLSPIDTRRTWDYR